MNKFKIIFAVILLTILLPVSGYALQESRPLPVDPRLRVITYSPNGIHKYVGFYEYQASIVLSAGEEVKTISMGDPTAWQILPSGNRIFLKPVSQDPYEANTNMLLITNKRTYHFILEAAEVDDDLGIDDPELVFETTFLYPDENMGAVRNFSRKTGPDLSNPELYNFNYTVSGSEEITPVRVFDNGQFTYFQFTNANVDMPAFFLIDSEGRESLVNYRVEGDYIVIERVASQFTLRHGIDIVCIFNESRPLKLIKEPKKRKKRVFW